MCRILFQSVFILKKDYFENVGIFHTNKDWEIGIRLFRGPLLIIGFLFLWGLNVYGWRSAGKTSFFKYFLYFSLQFCNFNNKFEPVLLEILVNLFILF